MEVKLLVVRFGVSSFSCFVSFTSDGCSKSGGGENLSDGRVWKELEELNWVAK